MKKRPRFVLENISSSTTYHFKSEDGWANCVVNDGSSDLMINSDWGSWSYRWGDKPGGFGTLTEFIAAGDCNYFSSKLVGGTHGMFEFSGYETVKSLKKELRRLYKDGDLDKSDYQMALDKVVQLDTSGSSDYFIRKLWDIHEYYDIEVFCEPWNLLENEPTSGYLALRHRIVPALVAACKKSVGLRKKMVVAGVASADGVSDGRS